MDNMVIQRPFEDALQGSDSVSDEEGSGSDADATENQPLAIQPGPPRNF